MMLAARLSSLYLHAQAELKGQAALLKRKLAVKPALLCCSAVLLALGFLPVSVTALAPVEVLPNNPFVLAAPFDGVVKSINIDQGHTVKPDEPLIVFDDVHLRNEKRLAEQRASIALARYQRASQGAIADHRVKREIEVARAEYELAQAESQYATELLQQAVVRFSRSFSDLSPMRSVYPYVCAFLQSYGYVWLRLRTAVGQMPARTRSRLCGDSLWLSSDLDGVALIILFPVLFTDTTDSWKLTSRRQRLVIGIAGVAVELSIAAVATLCWALLDDGALRATAFFIATTSWVMSLLVNLNPFMRFDAYYLLSDLLGVQNLQARSFAMGRWSLREHLFAFGEAPPEAMPRTMRRGLIAYAWATWLYRLFLFVGIAMLIYAMVFRPFGTFLGGVELLFFIGIPIMLELKQWWARRRQLLRSPRSRLTASMLLLLAIVWFVPWQSTVRIPAVAEALQQSPLYAPRVSQVVALHVARGDTVVAGDVLFTLSSPKLQSELSAAQRRVELTRAMLHRVAADAADREQRIVLETELQRWQKELAVFQHKISQLEVVAPVDGVVAELNQQVHAGRWIDDQTQLALITAGQGARVRGYVAAAELGRIQQGQQAVFIPEQPESSRLAGHITVVSSANAEHLTIPELVSHYDGPVPVNKVGQSLQPLKAWYNIHVEVEQDDLTIHRTSRGTLLTRGQPESLALRFWRRAVHVVLREVFI